LADILFRIAAFVRPRSRGRKGTRSLPICAPGAWRGKLVGGVTSKLGLYFSKLEQA
jgi:hypothetical protein